MKMRMWLVSVSVVFVLVITAVVPFVGQSEMAEPQEEPVKELSSSQLLELLPTIRTKLVGVKQRYFEISAVDIGGVRGNGLVVTMKINDSLALKRFQNAQYVEYVKLANCLDSSESKKKFYKMVDVLSGVDYQYVDMSGAVVASFNLNKNSCKNVSQMVGSNNLFQDGFVKGYLMPLFCESPAGFKGERCSKRNGAAFAFNSVDDRSFDEVQNRGAAAQEYMATLFCVSAGNMMRYMNYVEYCFFKDGTKRDSACVKVRPSDCKK